MKTRWNGMMTRRRYIRACQNRAYVLPQCTRNTMLPLRFGPLRKQPSRSSNTSMRFRRRPPRSTIPLTPHTRLLIPWPLHHRLFFFSMPTNTLLRILQCRPFRQHSFLVPRSSCTSRSPDAAFPSSPFLHSPLRHPRAHRSHNCLLISGGRPLQPYRLSNCNLRPRTTFA